MSEKHTPLPWHYQEDADDYTHIVRATGNRIVVSAGQDSSGKSEADCRLIVAAVNSYPSRQRLAVEAILELCRTNSPEFAERIVAAVDEALAAMAEDKF